MHTVNVVSKSNRLGDVVLAIVAFVVTGMFFLIANGCTMEHAPDASENAAGSGSVVASTQALTDPNWPGCYMNDLTQPIAGNWDVKALGVGYAAVMANAPANSFGVGQQNQWYIAWPQRSGLSAFATAAVIGSSPNPTVSSCSNSQRTITWKVWQCPSANISQCGNPAQNGLQGYTGTKAFIQYQGSCTDFGRIANSEVLSWFDSPVSKVYGATPETYNGATCRH